MRSIVNILIFTFLSLSAMAQRSHVVAFYNVENLFDTINCPTTADEDMLPRADREWNTKRYQAKLKSLAHAISNLASQHDYPTLIGLAEVENRAVAEALTHEAELAAAQYKVCHYDSPDERGIDVALLYRANSFHISGSRAIRAKTENPTRDILTAWGDLEGEEIFIAVVHWPSRISGVAFTEPERITCARQLREIVDSVQHNFPKRKILIMGDMNDNPNNRSISQILGAKRSTQDITHTDLYTPFANTKRGSSIYDNRWNRYDNIIVSSNMLIPEGLHIKPIKGKQMGGILHSPSMVDKRGHPRPTFKGSVYIGGASDHLPIYIILEK